jgi:membrane-associated phospholipid phosphatase
MTIGDSGSVAEVARTGAAPKRRPQEAGETSQRSFLGALLGAAASAAVSIGIATALFDRPVANWMHDHFGDERFGWFRVRYNGHLLSFGPFSLMASPAEALGPLAVFVFAVLAVSASAGWRSGVRGRIILALCLSVFAAIEITGVVKEVFGRTWPESWLGDNPSWIRDGVFGFFPFHGGPGWGSFPSGHTTVITAAATILWLVWPELRMAWSALVAIVVVGLLGANYHFVSDIVGGLYLGVGIGLSIARLTLMPNDRVASTAAPLNSAAPDEGRPSHLERQAPPVLDPTSTEGNRTDRTIVSPTASHLWTTSGPKAT